MLKKSDNFTEEFTDSSLLDSSAWDSFKAIQENFEKLMQFPMLN